VLGDTHTPMAEVVKATVFVVDMADFGTVNAVWTEVFATGGSTRPVRSVVGVAALPLGARVEVEGWAWSPGPPSSGSR